MVVYVNGKPIFVKNDQSRQSTLGNGTDTTNESKAFSNKKTEHQLIPINQIGKQNIHNRPAKIPYLLEAAASKSNLNNRYHRISSQDTLPKTQKKIIYKSPLTTSSQAVKTVNETIDSKQDQEYMQLVSLLRQKNEKLLFSPQIIKKNY